MSSDAGWDDLFTAASGSFTSRASDSDRGPREGAAGLVVSEGPPRKKKRKKQKTKVNVSEPSRCRGSDTMLSMRFEHSPRCIAMPKWLSLGPSLFFTKSITSTKNQPNRCKGWVGGDKVQKQGLCAERSCETCGLSPMHHSLRLDFSQNSVKKRLISDDHKVPFRLFAAVRDLRCCASVAADRLRADGSSPTDVSRVAFDKANQVMCQCNSLKSIPPGEMEILHCKCQSLRQQVVEWDGKAKEMYNSGCEHHRDGVARRTKPESSSGMTETFAPIFEALIEVIIACDAVYYRLYYLQITGVFPALTIGASCDGPACSMCIPHPTTYFGGLAWNVASGKSCLDQFVNKTIRPVLYGKNRAKMERCLSQYGLRCMVDIDKEINHSKCCGNQHPLECLHFLKLIETIALFWGSGWAQCEQRPKDWRIILRSKKSSRSSHTDSNFYSQHETPAIPLISRFRDASRDFPCNLYAYACIPSSSVDKLKEVMGKIKMTKGVIELGAGTGYIARLLNESGLKVTALDVAPTCSDWKIEDRKRASINEYHGSTPSFMTVQRSNVSGLKSFLRSESIASCTALLLCYPPPLSNMAFDALQSYTSLGGRCLIHIGEFRGLTGSLRFEEFLAQHFRCIERLPCLEWGTDAASITVWVAKSKVGFDDKYCPGRKAQLNQGRSFSSSLLLPCSNCLKAPAIRRCRLSRSLVYCGRECFDLHSDIRKAHLAMNMVFFECSYSDDSHFALLDSLENDAQRKKTTSPRKERR
mmetsp:Transcript_10708/g.31688  ORF Transcript_10708/g.31688 Transcript_10708/m.31688 type:complete len:755 (-) Transcript_10708:128-2392(-)